MWIWVTLLRVWASLQCIWSQNGVWQQRLLVKIPCNTAFSCENFTENKENEIQKENQKQVKQKLRQHS